MHWFLIWKHMICLLKLALSRKEELLSEMNIRLTRYDYYEDYKDAFGEAAAAGIKKDAAYQRAAASDITPLREFMG